MYALCVITRKLMDARITQLRSRAFLTITQNYKMQLDQIENDATKRLEGKGNCKSVQDHVEYLAVRLHVSFLTSELYRPALALRGLEPTQQESFEMLFIKSLEDTVEAFLEIQRLLASASNSWEFVHRALSSALLLGVMRKPLRNLRRIGLLKRLVQVISQVGHCWTSSYDGDRTEKPQPYGEALTVLRRLAEDDCDSHRKPHV